MSEWSHFDRLDECLFHPGCRPSQLQVAWAGKEKERATAQRNGGQGAGDGKECNLEAGSESSLEGALALFCPHSNSRA